MNQIKKIICAFCVLAAVAFSVPASACCGDGKAAAGAAQDSGDAISKTISQAASTITSWLEWINQSIEAGFARMQAEVARQTASIRTMEEGKAAVQTQLYMEKARSDAQMKYELSPRVCFETAGGAAATVAAGESREMLNGLNRDFAKRSMFTPNSSAAMAKVYDDHADKYCSQQDADLGRCRAADPRLQNADVRADTTLNSSSYTPEQLAAARSFVNNVANPMPTQNIPKDWEKTAQGKMFIAGQYVEQARASVAANSLNAAVSARTPIPGLGSSALLNKPDVSEMELMETMVKGRFENPSWYSMIAGFSFENLLREMNKIWALNVALQLQTMKTNERTEAVLATQLAIASQQEAAIRQREFRRAAATGGR